MMSRRRTKLPVPRKPAPGDTLGALRPFAEVDIPTGEDGEDVWLYVGRRDMEPPHLILEDFRRASRAVGLHEGWER